jgi:hypothetical protein
MEARDFVDRKKKRCMAQALEEFERRVEAPLRRGDTATALAGIPDVKRTFRKSIQALADDCADMMPSGVQINAFEPVVRS